MFQSPAPSSGMYTLIRDRRATAEPIGHAEIPYDQTSSAVVLIQPRHHQLDGTREPRGEVTRRVLLFVADDDGSAAVVVYDGSLGNRLHRIVGPLAMDLGSQQPQEARDSRVAEDDHVVDAGQSRKHLGTFGRGHDRTACPFQRPDARIVVHRDNQTVGFPGSARQIPHMADVQQVEAPVRERKTPPGRAVARHRVDQFLFGDDSSHDYSLIPSPQSLIPSGLYPLS